MVRRMGGACRGYRVLGMRRYVVVVEVAATGVQIDVLLRA